MFFLENRNIYICIHRWQFADIFRHFNTNTLSVLKHYRYNNNSSSNGRLKTDNKFSPYRGKIYEKSETS